VRRSSPDGGTGLLRDVADGLRSRPGRSGLAVLAVAVGAAALGLLLAAIASLETTSRRLVEELGANTIVAVPDGGSEGDPRPGRLTVRHVDLVRANFPELVASSVERSEARTLGTSRTLQVVATDSRLARARDWKLADGRFLDERDVASASHHVVLSHRLAAEWRWRVGQVVMLGEEPFVVVGIVHTQGGSLTGQLGDPALVLGERLVFVPRTVPASWSDRAAGSPAALDAVFLRAPEGTRPDRFVPALQGLLSAPGVSPGTLSWVTPETLVARIERLQTAIGWTAVVVGLLCLVLAGTTLMSLLVTNIRERVPEIGLRLALGATRREIAALFVTESLALTATGALLGTATAQGIAVLLGPSLPIGLETGWLSWGVPPAAALLGGVLFSWGPASRAGALSPATALRSE
jgi:putative ABC transport system permease protein